MTIFITKFIVTDIPCHEEFESIRVCGGPLERFTSKNESSRVHLCSHVKIGRWTLRLHGLGTLCKTVRSVSYCVYIYLIK